MSWVTGGLAGSGPPPGQRQLAYGTVATAPVGYNDPVEIVLPSQHYYTCVHWPKIHGSARPQVGADVLVAFDDLHNPRLVWWAGNFQPWSVPAGDVIDPE